jgi:hypothetical protein
LKNGFSVSSLDSMSFRSLQVLYAHEFSYKVLTFGEGYWLSTRSHTPLQSKTSRPTSIDDTPDALSIDCRLVGLVIGREGENFRRIESETGARIQF